MTEQTGSGTNFPIGGTSQDMLSIIDVTGQSYQLPAKPVNKPVPHWPQQYINSLQQLDAATPAQKAFYQHFKTNFLNGVYLDVKDNSNYYFILLFDLLNEAVTATTLDALEVQLKAIAEHCPKTASYARSYLIRKMAERADQQGIDRIVNDHWPEPSSTDQRQNRLGSRIKEKLSLSNDDVTLVNKLDDPNNSFCDIEFCLHQTVRLYLRTIKALNNTLIAENSSVERQFMAMAETMVQLVFHYKPDIYNFKYAVETSSSEFYTLLFKHCENGLRTHYEHKRKLTIEYNYGPEVQQVLEAHILSKLPEIIAAGLSEVQVPDPATEILLNEQNTTRWKGRLEKLTADLSGSRVQDFLTRVVQLGEQNKKNPSIENIFYEASKDVAKWDKAAALTLYVHYLYHDMHSAFFDQKPFAKTIQKSLFKNNDELKSFEEIVSNLIQTKDLEQALLAISSVYAIKRRKIQLDRSVISEVSRRHNHTADLLGDILSEEEEADTTTDHLVDVQLNVTPVNQPVVADPIAGLSMVQTELLELFVKSNFVVGHDEVEAFARSKSVFRNGLIDSVNESCFEKLDDVLIEEEEDVYTMNPDYYQLINSK